MGDCHQAATRQELDKERAKVEELSEAKSRLENNVKQISIDLKTSGERWEKVSLGVLCI